MFCISLQNYNFDSLSGPPKKFVNMRGKKKCPCLVGTLLCCRSSCLVPAQPKLCPRHRSWQNPGRAYLGGHGQPSGSSLGWLMGSAASQQGCSCTAPGPELAFLSPAHRVEERRVAPACSDKPQASYGFHFTLSLELCKISCNRAEF